MGGTRRGSQRARQLAVGILCLSLCLSGVGGAVAPEGIAPEILDSERTLLTIDVAETGDATWEVRYQINASTPETQAAFEELAADVENEPEQFIEAFRERASEMVDDAREETGREMGIAEVDVEVEEGLQEFGVIKYEFQWTRFANTSDTQLEIGDAISGLVVGEDNQLTIHWPESYELESVTPPVEATDDENNDHRVMWEGETVFGPNEPRLVVTETADSALPTGVLIGVLLLAGLVAVGALVRWRQLFLPTEDTDESPSQSVAETETGNADSAEPRESASTRPHSADGQTTDAALSPAESESSDGITSPREPETADPTDSTTHSEASPTDTKQEMLSSEERVLKVIEQSDGRVKQQTVTEQLGWSAARTSQVVTSLREDGRIESFRVGRENVLQLPVQED